MKEAGAGTANRDWVFDPRPPSGALQRGAGWVQTLSPGLRTLVREVLQNSRDQRLDDRPVRVRFTLQTLEGEALTDFLDALNWPSLEAHIRGAIDEGGPLAPNLRMALQEIDSGWLKVLAVEDSNGLGLVGEEDEPHANFNSLCRNVLDSGSDRPGRGGSFGLGKAVLWRFSSLSTVLFSSLPSDERSGRLRLFGRSELPGHATRSGLWEGPGWFGELMNERRSGQPRAVSFWEGREASMADRLGLARTGLAEPGTSVVILGFTEPTVEEEREPVEIMDDILRYAADSFWPNLAVEDPPGLQVEGRVFENERCTFERPCELEGIHHAFVRAATKDAEGETGPDAGRVVERSIPFTIPPHREARPVQPVDACLALRITRGDPGPLPAISPPPNSIALIRGAGMVVDYYQIPGLEGRTPPVWGVLLGGLARGAESSDVELEEFLRAAEPVTHEKWEVTERIRQDYRRGAGAALRRLWKAIRGEVQQMAATAAGTNRQGPETLRRLLTLPAGGSAGRDGDRKPGRFQVASLEAEFESEEGIWRFSGRVENPGASGAWGISIEVWLDAESGPGLPLPVGSLELIPGEAASRVQGKEGTIKCRVAPGNPQIAFRGRTQELGEDLAVEFIERTRLRIEINETRVPEAS